MRARIVVASAVGTVVAAVAFVVLDRDEAPRPATSGADAAAASPSPARRFRGAREDCSTRSEADFPGAYTSPRNLVVGPLVLIGGAYTDAETVREFGGNKFPLIVKSAQGHRASPPSRTGSAEGCRPRVRSAPAAARDDASRYAQDRHLRRVPPRQGPGPLQPE